MGTRRDERAHAATGGRGAPWSETTAADFPRVDRRFHRCRKNCVGIHCCQVRNLCSVGTPARRFTPATPSRRRVSP